jgi:prepilin-type N-terminal cleavage/methylation domain-containing protein
MMTIRRLPDRSPQRRRRSFACGYTLLEFIVAMTVLGIALSGLFPLTAILSRHLQPVKTPTSGGYDCRTPARDGNTTGNVAYSQHTWYLAPYAGPWARKLGASAQLLSALPGGSPPPGFAQTNSPVPVPPPVVSLDDYEPNGSPSSNPNDGSGTFACSGSGWQYVPSSGQPSFGDGGDYHSHLVPIDQNDSSLSDTASWQITVPADGWYTVQATWPATSDTTLPLAGAAYQVAITPARPVTPTGLLGGR